MNKLILILLFLPCLAFGQQLKAIDKGEAAPYKGFVIDHDMEKQMRQNANDLSILRVQKVKYEALTSMYDEDLREAKKGLRKAEMRATFGTIVGFTIGVSLSALASYAILKTLK